MRAQINRHLFSQTKYDSGALTPAVFVVHPYNEPGHYRADVYRNGQHQYTFSIDVNEKCQEMQISVDLAALDKKQKTSAQDCGCEKSLQLAPSGYGLFYTAKGLGGYSVKTYPATATEKDEAKIFDSTKLQQGDLFGITLLRPGYYIIRDDRRKIKCQLQVDPVIPGIKKYMPPDALHLEESDLLKPKKSLKLMQAQGLVYRTHADARILIELEKPIDPTETGEPKPGSNKGRKKPTKIKVSDRHAVASWRKGR
jgi:hypothetical protein